jgi:hypothetical protein
VWKGVPVNCGPKGLPFDANLLYRQRGRTLHGRVAASGIAKVTGRYAMTAAAADFDGDGWTDVYVACDSTPSILYRNNRDGTFTDTRVESGVAYGELGNAQAGMGLAVADYDRDGALDLLKTHFADDIPRSTAASARAVRGRRDRGRARVQNRYVEWGAGLPDLDNDGWPDSST